MLENIFLRNTEIQTSCREYLYVKITASHINGYQELEIAQSLGRYRPPVAESEAENS